MDVNLTYLESLVAENGGTLVRTKMYGKKLRITVDSPGLPADVPAAAEYLFGSFCADTVSQEAYGAGSRLELEINNVDNVYRDSVNPGPVVGAPPGVAMFLEGATDFPDAGAGGMSARTVTIEGDTVIGVNNVDDVAGPGALLLLSEGAPAGARVTIYRTGVGSAKVLHLWTPGMTEFVGSSSRTITELPEVHMMRTFVYIGSQGYLEIAKNNLNEV